MYTYYLSGGGSPSAADTRRSAARARRRRRHLRFHLRARAGARARNRNRNRNRTPARSRTRAQDHNRSQRASFLSTDAIATGNIKTFAYHLKPPLFLSRILFCLFYL